MLYSRFDILPRSVVRRQTGFAARITRTLSCSNDSPIKISIRNLLILTAIIALCVWLYVRQGRYYGIDKDLYEQGYVEAFTTNGAEGAYWHFGTLPSKQVGYDDGLSDFGKIYQHDWSYVGYSRSERVKEVMEHVEESTILQPKRKALILSGLKSELEQELQVEREKENAG